MASSTIVLVTAVMGIHASSLAYHSACDSTLLAEEFFEMANKTSCDYCRLWVTS